MLDGNQHVQEAACSALAIVEECTHPSLLAAHLQVNCCLIYSRIKHWQQHRCKLQQSVLKAQILD